MGQCRISILPPNDGQIGKFDLNAKNTNPGVHTDGENI